MVAERPLLRTQDVLSVREEGDSAIMVPGPMDGDFSMEVQGQQWMV